MTIQQKLDLFTKKTMESVNRQCLKVTLEIQNTIKIAILETKEKAHKEMADIIRAESYQLEREANKKIHAASMEARRGLFTLQERLAKGLFNDLEKSLQDFTGTPAYKDFLFEGVATVMDNNFLLKKTTDLMDKSCSLAPTGTHFSIMQLMAQDTLFWKLKELIETETSFTVEAVDEDFIGGFRLMSENRRIIADYTLISRLKNLRIESEFSHLQKLL